MSCIHNKFNAHFVSAHIGMHQSSHEEPHATDYDVERLETNMKELSSSRYQN